MLAGLPALRLKGLYLALVTLMLAGGFQVMISATGFPDGGDGFLGRISGSERLMLPRGAREEVLTREVARYARRLEDYCRKAPDNWFNFFDFWEMGAS